jgi:hypothetical protein
MDAVEWAEMLLKKGVVPPAGADVVLFDPPYSPRQISECYKHVGRKVSQVDTQNARIYKRVRDAFDPLVKSGGVVLSFGWISAGMGKGRGYEQREIMLVAHGSAHNDTICVAEQKVRPVAPLQIPL